MNRRDFLNHGICSALALPVVTTAFASPAIIPSRRHLIFSGSSRPQQDAYGLMEHAFRHTFEKLTTARTRLHIAKPMTETYTEVVSGRCDVSIGFMHAAVTQHPVFGFFAGLPCSMGLPSERQTAWINSGDGQELWDRLGFEHGIKPLFAGHVATHAVALQSRRMISEATHFQNMRVQATGLVRDVVAGLGATPVIFNTDNEIDAVQFGMCPSRLALDGGKSPAHVISGGFLPHGSTLAVSVQRKTWERLTRFEQQSMQMAARVAAASFKDFTDTRHRTDDGTGGVLTTVTSKMPLDVTTAANRIAEAVVADIASTDQLSARINASYLAARSRQQI
jgi:TRAP-type mannitol/chloroaromatic compound transport system substrate-binding protein